MRDSIKYKILVKQGCIKSANVFIMFVILRPILVICMIYVSGGLLDIMLTQALKHHVREHPILPAIKVTFDWLMGHDSYLSHDAVSSHK